MKFNNKTINSLIKIKIIMFLIFIMFIIINYIVNEYILTQYFKNNTKEMCFYKNFINYNYLYGCNKNNIIENLILSTYIYDNTMHSIDHNHDKNYDYILTYDKILQLKEKFFSFATFEIIEYYNTLNKLSKILTNIRDYENKVEINKYNYSKLLEKEYIDILNLSNTSKLERKNILLNIFEINTKKIDILLENLIFNQSIYNYINDIKINKTSIDNNVFCLLVLLSNSIKFINEINVINNNKQKRKLAFDILKICFYILSSYYTDKLIYLLNKINDNNIHIQYNDKLIIIKLIIRISTLSLNELNDNYKSMIKKIGINIDDFNEKDFKFNSDYFLNNIKRFIEENKDDIQIKYLFTTIHYFFLNNLYIINKNKLISYNYLLSNDIFKELLKFIYLSELSKDKLDDDELNDDLIYDLFISLKNINDCINFDDYIISNFKKNNIINEFYLRLKQKLNLNKEKKFFSFDKLLILLNYPYKIFLLINNKLFNNNIIKFNDNIDDILSYILLLLILSILIPIIPIIYCNVNIIKDLNIKIKIICQIIIILLILIEYFKYIISLFILLFHYKIMKYKDIKYFFE